MNGAPEMLKITIRNSAAECRFHLAGRLAGEGARELETAWRTASSAAGGRLLTVDLRDVQSMDADGVVVLRAMRNRGVRVIEPGAVRVPSRPWSILRFASALGMMLLLLACAALARGAEPPAAHATLERYLAYASSEPQAAADTATRLDIEASLPSMNRSGVLQALEYVPRGGKALIRVLGFEGDSTVKRQVIARYLSAEAEAHQQQRGALALTRANYNFRFLRSADYNDRSVWVYRVEPRRKRTGLFEGELWIDGETAAPLRQWGVFVKNPSLFIKRVYFVRDYDAATAAPRRLIVSLDTRIAGTAELTIWYRPVAPDAKLLAAFSGEQSGF